MKVIELTLKDGQIKMRVAHLGLKLPQKDSQIDNKLVVYLLLPTHNMDNLPLKNKNLKAQLLEEKEAL